MNEKQLEQNTQDSVDIAQAFEFAIMLLLLNEFEEIEYTQLEKRIEVLENEIELIKQTISEGGGEVPPIEIPDDSKENPITAYAGMTYYKDKYYKEKENVYLCTRDSDSEPGSEIVLNYLPSQLVGIYFSLVEE